MSFGSGGRFTTQSVSFTLPLRDLRPVRSTMDPGAGDDLDDEFDLDLSVVASDDVVGEEVSVAVQVLSKKRKRKSEKNKAIKVRNYF